MTSLPSPPTPEPPPDRDMLKLAPVFAAKVFDLLHRMDRLGHDAIVFEGFRSDERQAWLYGCGRQYDDGRGIVTNAADGRHSWHRYGLAVDVISRSLAWNAHAGFWLDLRNCARDLGLTSGYDWTHPDRPHVQWHCDGMYVTPSDHAWALLQSAGVAAVWTELHADEFREVA